MQARRIRTIVDAVACLTAPLDGCPHTQTTDMDLPSVYVQKPSASALDAARAAHVEELDTLAESLGCFDLENRRAVQELCERTIQRIGGRFTALGVVVFPLGASSRRRALQSE